jgi:chemotaxis protein CheD
MFADTGIPHLIDKLESLGASRERLIVKIAGGAQFVDHRDLFAIGKRNYAAMRKVLARESLQCSAENIGGTFSRTLFLEIGSGRVWFEAAGKEAEL